MKKFAFWEDLMTFIIAAIAFVVTSLALLLIGWPPLQTTSIAGVVMYIGELVLISFTVAVAITPCHLFVRKKA